MDERTNERTKKNETNEKKTETTKWGSDYRERYCDQNECRIIKIGAMQPYFWPLQSLLFLAMGF